MKSASTHEIISWADLAAKTMVWNMEVPTFDPLMLYPLLPKPFTAAKLTLELSNVWHLFLSKSDKL